ncbi:MAG: molybdopterin converting factor subunit 1 [Candidatus Hydrothermarchaeales archaeon]
MGHVKIRFFAGFREKTGMDEMSLEIGDQTTVAQIINELNESLEGLNELLMSGTAIVAVNQEVVKPESIIYAGAEIAIFPPVSGG